MVPLCLKIIKKKSHIFTILRKNHRFSEKSNLNFRAKIVYALRFLLHFSLDGAFVNQILFWHKKFKSNYGKSGKS